MLKLKWNPAPSHSSNFFVLFSYNDLDDIFNKEPNVQVAAGTHTNCGRITKNFNHNLLLELTGHDTSESNIARLLNTLEFNDVSNGKIATVNLPAALCKGNGHDGTLRMVYPIFSDVNLSFRAGLTVHAQRGTWSSLPHHFEREEILRTNPVPFFEKFAYITNPEGGEGIQTRVGHLYKAGTKRIEYNWTNDLMPIHDKNIIDIPLGSHAVTGGPGVRLAYFWVYADYNNLRGREKFEDGDTPD